LVYPNKGLEEPKPISGANVALEGEVFDLLDDVYSSAERECKIDISFNHGPNGEAVNPCRSLLLEYANAPSVETGLPLAVRLGEHSTRRSALGLLFLGVGQVDGETKVLVARFAANSGILADENAEELTVSFIQRVFMRNAGAYKAVIYQGILTPQAFWSGKAVDRQINSREVEVSRYWITDFLMSDFRTTSAQGTRVLAVAMRNAAKNSANLRVKNEIAASATLGANLNGQVMTGAQFLEQLALSAESREAVTAEFRHNDLANEQFRFSAEEFQRQLPYKTVELDSGAMLTAPAAEFDAVFDRGEVNDAGEVTYTATGAEVGIKLTKRP
jgi:hypothetical protein